LAGSDTEGVSDPYNCTIAPGRHQQRRPGDRVGSYLDAAPAAVAEMGGHVAKKLADGLLALSASRSRMRRRARARAAVDPSIKRALNDSAAMVVEETDASLWC